MSTHMAQGPYPGTRPVTAIDQEVMHELSNIVNGSKPKVPELSRSEVASFDRRLLQADEYIRSGRLKSGEKVCMGMITDLLGKDFCVPAPPSSGVKIERYIDMDLTRRMILFQTVHALAKAMLALGDFESALAWIDEVDNNSRNIWFAFPICFVCDWVIPKETPTQIGFLRTWTLVIKSLGLFALGNTAAAQHCQGLAREYIQYLPSTTPQGKDLIARLHEGLEFGELLPYTLHPDPFKNPKFQIVDSKMLVRGAWKKLLVKNGIMGRRRSASSFVWKSHLYVIGGLPEERNLDHRDVWRLNLQTLDSWNFVCRYPIPKSDYLSFRNREMRVCNDRAYLFTGRPALDYFDLKTQRWETILTKYRLTTADREAGLTDSWPWPGNRVEDTAQQIAQGRLFIFGGSHSRALTGCNLFMELNLKTFTWRRLSGTPMQTVGGTQLFPGPRKCPGSWISKDQNKFYLLYGQCDKNPNLIPGDISGPWDAPYMPDDMWSWDIKEEQWRRERIPGNHPSPRSGMGCIYNQKLDRVIVFGGHNLVCPYISPDTKRQASITVYADTFTFRPYDPNHRISSPRSQTTSSIREYDEPRWQQVTTCGFPSHRSLSSLVCDPDTGKVYLFGGGTRTDVVPSRSQSKMRLFRDLWQLHIDIPGGYFQGVNIEDEMRSARPGPWSRCYHCEKTGFLKKCGGTCGGRVFFCGPACQREGWADHKWNHNCHKPPNPVTSQEIGDCIY